MQVSVFSIVFMAISAFVSIVAPIVLFIVFYKKYNVKIIPMLAGIAGFVLFALILEGAIHSIVFAHFALRKYPFVFIVYGVFMAGIFEETARFISFKILKKKYHGIETGLAYGIGHGGIESVVVGGLSMVNAIVISAIINAGNIETITSKLQGDALEQTTAQLTMLATSPSYSFLAGGIERIFAIAIQMSLSIIVFYSVYGKNKLWLYPLAILLHAVMDIPAAAMQAGVIKNVYVVELLLFISAIIFILIAKYTHGKLKQSLMET